MQMKRFSLFFTICFFCISVSAQKKWDLRSCVEYAMTNNITVKLSDVQSKIAALTYKQSKLSQYPNANFSVSSSVNSGNNQDPTTFTALPKHIYHRDFNYRQVQIFLIFIASEI